MPNITIDVVVGEPVDIGPLRLFPLIGGQPSALDYAVESDALVIEELAHPTVPTLQVKNKAAHPVLLVEGEALVGGDQDRTLNISVLVPAAAAIEVPVSCVEAGRWGARRGYQRHHTMTPWAVRRLKNLSATRSALEGRRYSSDQGGVWASVDHVLHSRGVQSESRAWKDSTGRQDRQEVQPEVPPVLDGQVGVVSAAGDEIIAVELFDRHQSLLERWEALVGGLTEEVFGSEGAAGVTTAQVQELLAQVRAAPLVETEAVGLGRQLRHDSPSLHVAALADGEVPIHLTAFPLDERDGVSALV